MSRGISCLFPFIALASAFPPVPGERRVRLFEGEPRDPDRLDDDELHLVDRLLKPTKAELKAQAKRDRKAAKRKVLP